MNYIRDGRAPIPTTEFISKVMSANKNKSTKPELSLRRALWKNDIKGYRLNYKRIPGKPDIVFVSRKIAIFVNGCYWHRCPKCKLPLPQSNTPFWSQKFERNIKRDKRKTIELKKMQWTVVIVWECEIKKNIVKSLNKIRKIYYEKKA
jgi:DNA mismatch endonuclease (patch repair protein)